MITLFDQEQVWKDYINSLISNYSKEQAKTMYEDGMPINKIAKYVKTDVTTVEKWLGING